MVYRQVEKIGARQTIKGLVCLSRLGMLSHQNTREDRKAFREGFVNIK